MAKRKERPTPKVGSRFQKTYEGKCRTLHVAESEGRICYKMDGRIFNSPSAAAKTLTKAEVNGWKFWEMD
jgi:hypothetical protein